MARGTLVGEAFIRVHADNTAFAREIATGMRGLKEGADEQGRGWGKQFFDAVKSELEQKMEREFKQGFLTGDFTNFAKNFGTMEEALGTINQRLATMRRWGGLSREEFDDLAGTVERFRRGIVNVADVRSMEDYAASLTKAAREMGVLRDGSQSTAVSTDDLVRHMDAMDDQVEKNRRGFDQWASTLTRAAESMGHLRDRTDDTSLDLRDLLRTVDEGRDFEALADKMSKASREMGFQRDQLFATSISWKEIEKHLEKFGRSTAIKDKTKDVDDLDRGFSRILRTLSTLGRRIDGIDFGRMFGKGSRNDFLNIVGSIIGGITKAADVVAIGLIKPIEFGILKPLDLMIDKLAETNTAVGRAFSGFQEHFGSLSSVATKTLSPIISAVAALGAVSVGVVGAILLLGEAVGVVTSALSLLLGGVIAVAGALETALIGALVVAAPLLVGLAAGIGTVVVAFANMSDKTKKAFDPLQAQFKKIAESVEKTFFKDIPLWVKTASDVLKTFAGPTMERVATDVRIAISGIAKSFQTPEVKKSLDAWSAALGPIAGNLTSAFGAALTGGLAFFEPILPLAQQLSEKIEKTANDFSKWAQSAEGQESIKKFFTTASQEADTLWSILTNIASSLQTVLNIGNSAAGIEFLGWLDEKTADLKAFLESPEGQTQLNDWFNEAQTFGENLWTTIEKIGGALQKLNSPQNQEFANKLVIAFGRLADVIGALAPAFEVTGKAIGFFFTFIAGVFASMLQTVSFITRGLSAMAIAIGTFTHNEGLVKLGEDLGKVSASTEEAAGLLGGLPDQVNIDFTANAGQLKTTVEDSKTMISFVDKEHTTHFLGSEEGLEAAAAAANTGIATVPKKNLTDFSGKIDNLEKVAAGAQETVKTVPPEWTTKMLGDSKPLEASVAASEATLNNFGETHGQTLTRFLGNIDDVDQKAGSATKAVNGVPDENTTKLLGNDKQLQSAVASTNAAINTIPASKTTSLFLDLTAFQRSVLYAKSLLNDLGQARVNAAGRAAGGIFGAMAGTVLRGPQVILAGEDGPEAVVPLRRSLARVDPSVRALSAFAQGMMPTGPGINIAEGAIQVSVPNANPVNVAESVLDRLVARLS